MTSSDQEFLATAFGWGEKTVLQLLHEGENLTYRASSPAGTFAVRRYRQGHRYLAEIEAEVAWMSALDGHMMLAPAIRTVAGDPVAVRTSGGEADLFVAFEFVGGDPLYEPGPEHFFELGLLLRRLHKAADEVSAAMTASWAGWNRPSYDEAMLIERPLRRLLAAPFLPQNVKSSWERAAARLEELCREMRSSFVSLPFVHGDLHFGNVLVTGRGWVCLDFDECGFAPRCFDAGVVRYHARSRGVLDEVWSAFAEGYGGIAEQEARLGAALRIMYAAGKLPGRLDIRSIGEDPVGKVEQHLSLLDAEMF